MSHLTIIDLWLESCRIKHPNYQIYAKDKEKLASLMHNESRRQKIETLTALRDHGIINFSFLDPRERKVMELRLIKLMTLEDVAIEFGVTRERIRQIEAKALELIKSHNER